MLPVWEGFQKGVNLGGWLSQFDRYDPRHFDTFITEKDIGEIAAVGFDHVRLPVDYIVLEDEDGVFREEGFARLRRCLDWCRAHDLRCVIDLHECFGYSFDPLKKDMDRRRFFFDAALQDRFLRLWTELARRFGGEPEWAAFEPLNEVVPMDVAKEWNDLIRRYVETVRPLAPRTWLVVGGVCYNNVRTVEWLELPEDDRIVCNFHCYDPHIFTHQGAYWVEGMPRDFRIGYPLPPEDYRAATRRVLHQEYDAVFDVDTPEMGPAFFDRLFAPAVAAAERRRAPLYCGEYGVIDLADNGDKLRWLRDIHAVFAARGIGRALWNYREKDFGLVDERFASIRDEFIRSL